MKTQTFKEIIGLWPSTAELAADLGQKVDTVRKWNTRNRIPAEHWEDLLKSAKKRKIKLVESDLFRLIARKAA